MAYEIDFLPCGDPGEDGRCCRSGDAIALRWGNLSGSRLEQTVMIVDGGFTSSGKLLVEHVKQWYGTDVVDYAVSSHPHDDHIQGKFEVLESLKIGTLLMHKPWEHARAVVDLTNDGRLSYRGSNRRIKESFESAWELYKAAVARRITVVEPFQGIGTQAGDMLILGPSKDFYQRLLAADLAEEKVSQSVQPMSVLERALRALAAKVTEVWDTDALAEPSIDAVEPLNHTSTIIHMNFGSASALLTADAGVLALEQAVLFAESQGIDLKRCTRVQVPHHGSKRNVGPKILDRILGPILPQGAPGTKTGMLSAATHGAPKHPSARVTNAFLRRGAPVCGTLGTTKWFHSHDAPPRATFSPAPSIPFQDTYDEGDD